MSSLENLFGESVLRFRATLTDAEVYVNGNPTQFALSPTFTMTAAHAAAQDVLDYQKTLSPPACLSNADFESIERVANAKTHEDFMDRFTIFFWGCIQARDSEENPRCNYSRYVDFVYALRKHGAILLPPLTLFSVAGPMVIERVKRKRYRPTGTKLMYDNFTNELIEVLSAKNVNQLQRWTASVPIFIGATQGMTGLTDFSFDAVNQLALLYIHAVEERGMKVTPKLSTFAYVLIQSLCEKFAHDLHEKGLDTDPVRQSSPLREKAMNNIRKGDLDFDWMTQKHPNAEFWRDLLSTHVRGRTVADRSSIIYQLNTFAQFLIDTDLISSKPEDIERTRLVGEGGENESFEAYLARRSDDKAYQFRVMNHVRWILDRYRNDHRHLEIQTHIRKDDLSAPGKRKPRPGQSTKLPVPIKIMKLAKEVLVENNFAWPKLMRTDWFDAYNPETRNYEPVWSPVRAVATYALLTIPVRGIQIRRVDSGEGDAEIYDPETKTWRPNPNHWCPDGRTRQVGIFRKMVDSEVGRTFTGLFFNSRKTGYSDIWEGQEIPWEEETLFKHLAFVRDWQMKYNPVLEPVSIGDLDAVKSQYLDEEKSKLPRFYFLFRDNLGKGDPHHLIDDVRLRDFFTFLMAEVEDRLWTSGERNQDGSRIRLITHWTEHKRGPHSKGRTAAMPQWGRTPDTCIFTIHSLRVGGITAFAKAGVPIEIISEFLAGHSTILMTIYYEKFGQSFIQKVLEKAYDVMEHGLEQEQWTAFIQDMPLDDLLNNIAFNSMEGAESLHIQPSGLWSLDIDGICPVGRSMCDQGGPKIGNDEYAQVPGGRGNCPLCRFFVTGPAFLHGQVIRANELLFVIREKAQAVIVRDNELNDLLALARPPRDKVKRLQSLLERLDQETMTLIETWAARYVLALKSLEVLRSETGYQFKFVSSGDVKDISIGLENATDFDLMDFIAQACEVHTEIQASLANVRRNNVIDRVLDVNGFGSMLLHLDPDTALKSGNAFTSVLTSKFGRQHVNAIVNGDQPLALDSLKETRELLDELGLSMSRAAGQPLKLEASAIKHAIKRQKSRLIKSSEE